jgi:hypothetical protein
MKSIWIAGIMECEKTMFTLQNLDKFYNYLSHEIDDVR